jgi:uncharacterized protein YbjT (DUF2867 family)
VLPIAKVELAFGDLGKPVSLYTALNGVNMLVNVASLGFGHAPSIVAAAEDAEVKRAIFVSTTAIFTTLDALSKRVRIAAEKAIKNSQLSYTILRPTMIYGSSRDRNICRLIRYVSRYPILPVFGSGEYLQQPVYVEDVANAIVQAVTTDNTLGRCYEVSGGSVVTYNQLVHTVSKLLQRRTMLLHLPTRPFTRVLSILESLSVKVPIKAEQIMRLNEDKDFEFGAAAEAFGYQPRSLEEGLKLEMIEMGLKA